MELIQIKKAWLIVQYVTQASGVLVLEWRHLKNALMESIAIQLVHNFVSCVQEVIGEVLVLVHTGQEYYQIIQQFTHSWFHTLV